MTWTLIQLEALEGAIAEGARTVRYTDGTTNREVTYHSLQDMIALRNVMRRELGLDASGTGRKITTSAYDGGL